MINDTLPREKKWGKKHTLPEKNMKVVILDITVVAVNKRHCSTLYSPLPCHQYFYFSNHINDNDNNATANSNVDHYDSHNNSNHYELNNNNKNNA